MQFDHFPGKNGHNALNIIEFINTGVANKINKLELPAHTYNLEQVVTVVYLANRVLTEKHVKT